MVGCGESFVHPGVNAGFRVEATWHAYAHALCESKRTNIRSEPENSARAIRVAHHYKTRRDARPKIIAFPTPSAPKIRHVCARTGQAEVEAHALRRALRASNSRTAPPFRGRGGRPGGRGPYLPS